MDDDDVPDRLKCRRDNWRTPPYVVEAVRRMFGGKIRLDPCADETNNVGAEVSYTVGGEHAPWVDATFWNPPWGKKLKVFTQKNCEEAQRPIRTAGLLPAGARFSTGYFQQQVLIPPLTCMLVFDHRLAFVNPDTGEPQDDNMYDSILYMYNVRPQDAAAHLRGLGRVIATGVWT